MTPAEREERRARREWAKQEVKVCMRMLSLFLAALTEGRFERASHLRHELEWLPKGWPIGLDRNGQGINGKEYGQ